MLVCTYLLIREEKITDANTKTNIIFANIHISCTLLARSHPKIATSTPLSEIFMKADRILPYVFIFTSALLYGCGGSSDSTTSTSETDDTSSTAVAKIVINEIVAKASDNGNDWIELYVVEGTADLSNYTLVDDNVDHEQQALPNVTLSQGEYIVIQAISDTDTPPENGYYVTFKLGNADSVTLFKNNVQVDQLSWVDGDAPEGSSYGLFANGTGTAQTLAPTEGATNEMAADPIVYDLILNENTPLRINEVVAKDASGGLDWIELYVSGTTAVQLSDYSLRDENSVLMALPAVALAPGAFYRIYATTDTSQVPQSQSSVNFKLASSDAVSLFLGDDLVDQLQWDKGQALIGQSYGRFPDGSDGTKTLTPSPLTTNVAAVHGPLVINEVVANDANGGNDWFELYNNGSATIALADYQVIDESNDIEPANLPDVDLLPGEYLVIYATTENPNQYYVPFKLGKSDELSLMHNGETVDYVSWNASDVIAGFSYGLRASNSTDHSWEHDLLTPSLGAINTKASAFNADVVNQLSINITQENWQDILDNPLDEAYHEASITLNGITLDSVAIRTKGGSSLTSVAQSASDRYSFKIDINKYVSGQKFFGLKKFTLQNSFNDPSYMREVIAYDLLDEMGVATPEHAYVNIYVNGELFGLYVMVEAIDSTFLDNHFANNKGDLYKPDGVGSDLLWIDNNISSYSDINLKTNEETTDNGAFINFVESLDQGATDKIAVDSLLRYLSVSVALSNLDSYHGSLAHNYYLYDQDGVFSLLPWDFNEAFGTFAMGCNGVDVRELYVDEPITGPLADRPLVANVFANQTYLTTYHDYLWQLINGPLTSDAFAARVAKIAALIGDSVANDPSAFYSADDFENNINTTVDRFFGLTEFINYRVDNMTKQLQGDLPTAGVGDGFCVGGGGMPPPN